VDKLAELLLLNPNWRSMWLRMRYQYAEFKQLVRGDSGVSINSQEKKKNIQDM